MFIAILFFVPIFIIFNTDNVLILGIFCPTALIVKYFLFSPASSQEMLVGFPPGEGLLILALALLHVMYYYLFSCTIYFICKKLKKKIKSY